jgi:endonuclease/exonuclease/phosphatase family metal-dependent hydrolase
MGLTSRICTRGQFLRTWFSALAASAGDDGSWRAGIARPLAGAIHGLARRANMGTRHLATAALALLLAGIGAGDAGAQERGRPDSDGRLNSDLARSVRVMTRNLYLGADLGPAIRAPDLTSFVAATGGILRQVTATQFPTRVQGLAEEILATEPDLVGLQEVALWRTGPPSLAPLLGAPNTAATVRHDFLELLLGELNAGRERYRVVVVQEAFDLEAPADENGVAGDGPAPIVNAELNARLTMRDVILARVDRGVHVWNPDGDNFENLLVLPILGASVPVARGWTSVDARVRGSLPFRFVNTHLEAFHPGIRALQAAELVAPGGPATGDLPVVLVGDLNSDDDTVAPVDQQAYRVLLAAGFVSRSTGDPQSCCVSSYDLTTGSVEEFDHQVDHIMTNAPEVVRLVTSLVTGLVMQNGFWNSDHAGVFSALLIRRGRD